MIGIDGLFVDGLSIATVRSGSSHVVNKKEKKRSVQRMIHCRERGKEHKKVESDKIVFKMTICVS